MKKYFLIYALALCAFIGCKDNSGLSGLLNDYDYRISALEQLCKQLNTNIDALQTLINAQQTGDYITAITPIKENGVEVGYTITFAKHDSVTIYHGKDGANGKDGQNGKDGKDGQNGTNGTDGHTPIIGVAKDTDGIYYWTLDGEWLLDSNGNKLRVTGEDGKDGQNGQNGTNGTNGTNGVTPQLKIEGDYWFISYDNGTTWTQLGKAKGDKGDNGTNGTNGQDGDSMFQSVTQDTDNVYFTLTDGTVITVAKNNAISSPDGYNVTGTKNGYQYVELGLPSGTKWATCNVGSNLPAGRGKMFAWGETEVKSEYTQANYVPNYNSLPNCISGTQYDAATANLAAPWQIPTKAQMEELVNYATFTETTYNDVAGYRITGPNGNSIFIPKIPFGNSPMNFIYLTGDKAVDYPSYNSVWCIAPYLKASSTSSDISYSGTPSVHWFQDYTYTSSSGYSSYRTYFYYYGGYYIRPVWND